VAGGTGYSGAQELCGAALRGWDRGFWRSLVTNEASAHDDPEGLDWSTGDPTLLATDGSGLVQGDAANLYFSAAPVHSNGLGIAQVASDYVELVVDYEIGAAYGWGFDTPGTSEGWSLADGSEAPVGDTGIWSLALGDEETTLLSQFIDVDFGDFETLHIRARTTCAQPFTVGWKSSPLEDFGPDSSLSVALEPDGQWRTAVLPLAGEGDYGTLERLRLVLPAGCAGQMLDLDWLRLSGRTAPVQ